MKAKTQLFTYHDFSVDSVKHTYPVSANVFSTLKYFPFLRWPSDVPCELANVYLLEVSEITTGESLKTYASQLSHLLRYCWNEKISFECLTDIDLHKLSTYLLKETVQGSNVKRCRNNNTVRDILSRCILFLVWLQENFISKNGEVLIGSKDKLPRISVANRINGCKGKLHNSLVHKSMPVNCSREPKHPISQYTIERIEQMIEAVSIVANQNDRTLRRYRSNLSLFEEKLQYLRARRRFMIWLLKRTGLRPSEMVEMKVTDHLHILQNLKLIIPTKKRRRHNAPNRSFPISLKDAATVQRYLSCRDRFISYLGKVSSSVPDVFFLGDNGSAIKKSSLEKDFSRLAKLSGFVDTQVCISMFRHRFITFEVIVHFKEFLECSGKTRQIMTDADYRSILRRIASKTGHGSEESLWHYIDLAWAELDVWGGVERALERLQAADQLFEQLLDLKTFAVNQSRNDIAAELGKIIDDASTFRN